MMSGMEQGAPAVDASLIARLRADPARAPEALALAAASRHGPAAREWLAEQRAKGRTDPAQLSARARRNHGRLARLEGAASGLGGIATVLPDIVAVAWIQSRMVFFIAGAHGFDPGDPMRPAELLVLQGVFDDPLTARAALDGAGASLAGAYVGRHLRKGDDEALVSRLVRMVARRGGQRLAGRAIPGVASLFSAVQNESDTKALADAAIRFYGG
jgi:hypothetical protein